MTTPISEYPQYAAESKRGRAARRSTLPLWITAVCVGVIVFASLQPFSGWIAPPPAGRFFLWQFAQRWNWADVVFNVMAYVPLGLALGIAWPRGWSVQARWLCTMLFAVGLSIAMEYAQTWLPSRYASVFDTLANTAGAVTGALISLAMLRYTNLLAWIRAVRDALVVQGDSGDLMLVLLSVWLLAQANPAIPLFAATFHPGSQSAFEPVVVIVELAQTASALVGIGLFTDLMMRKRWLGGVALAMVVLLAIGLKTAAAYAFLNPVAWEQWLRPGHTLGLAAGAFSLMLLFWLPRGAKSVLAGIALLSGVLVMLLLPDFVATKAPLSIFNWNYGQLLNLNGLTHTIMILWPFAATAALWWRFALAPTTHAAG